MEQVEAVGTRETQPAAGGGEEIPEEIASAHESRTTNGGQRPGGNEVLGEEALQAFQLEADSEDELQDGNANGEEPDYDPDPEVGYGIDYTTETANDGQLTSEQPYDDEDDDYYQSSQNPEKKQQRRTVTDGGSYMSQSYMTRKSKRSTRMDEDMGDMASNEALARLKNRINKQRQKKVCVGPDEVLESLRGFHNEKLPLDNDRLDLFFVNNKFLTDFRDQTDHTAVHECYKALTLKSYEKGQTVFRYGTTGDECFFIIKGKVVQLAPQLEQVVVRTEQDLVKFYAENFDDVIWDKVEEGEELKELATLYRNDPDALDFAKEKDAQSKPSGALDVNAPYDRMLDSMREGLQRSGSSHSRRSIRVSNTHPKEQAAMQPAKSNANLKSQSYFGEQGVRSFGEAQSDQTYTEDVWVVRRMDELGPGQNFGQSALVQSKPHLCAYLCVEPCEIASVNRESYTRIVEKAVKRDFQGRVQFLKSFRILETMSQTQLENLLYHVKLINFERGRTVFKAGDKPDGVYLVQEGAFELTKPGELHAHVEKLVEQMNVDPMAKFHLRKQAKVLKDSSRAQIKLAILGTGEVFGLEECQVRPQSLRLKNRGYSVTCQENGSKAIFINHQAFTDKVLYDPNVERAVKFDSALKEYFHNSRELQYQQTVWNGSLTSVKQIENAAEKAEADFEERLKRDPTGAVSKELKGLPRLYTVDRHLKDKFEAEILNKIMGQIHERAAETLSGEDPDVQAMVAKKMREIENHFDSTVNVINAERKQQKKTKELLRELSEIQKVREQRHNLSVEMSKALTSQATINQDSATANRDALRDQSYFQDSLLSSHNQLSPEKVSLDFQSLSQARGQHFSSVDDGMKVIHSVIKEKRGREMLREDSPQQNFQFVSMDQDISLAGANRRRKSRAPGPQPGESEASEPHKQPAKVGSPFGLHSDVQTVAPAVLSHKGKSIAIEQQETPMHMMPPTSGGRSDEAEFKGLQDSQPASKQLMSPQTPIEKPNDYATGADQNAVDKTTGLPPANRTQDAFKPKEMQLLERFEDQKSRDRQRADAAAKANQQSNEADAAALKQANDGGIIVSKPDPRGKADKKFSNATEDVNPQVNDVKGVDSAGKEAPHQQLSETTANPSNLGNVSNIRDPRYSQEQAKAQAGAKKRLGLASNIGIPGQKPFGLMNKQKHVVPKVDFEKDSMPVYQEGDEINEAQGSEAPKQANQPPVVNITTRLTSKQESAAGAGDSKAASAEGTRPKPEQQQEPELAEAVPEAFAAKQTVLKAQGPLGNELPFNDLVSKGGLKGAKRNQIMNVSKTLNDRSIKSKLRMINKDSANPLPQDQLEALQSINNSFTADMPEVYTLNYQQSLGSGGRAGKGHLQSMFPSINAAGRHNTLPKDSFLRNADISMIDTAHFSNDAMAPLDPTSEIMRFVETHHSNESKREVFVPSQINPRMKRGAGKNVPGKRLHQLRGASAKSYETKTAKGRPGAESALRSNSFVPAGLKQEHRLRVNSIKSEDYVPGGAPVNPDATASSRNQSFDKTGNSYAKQMQNLDDTQYRTAMMREAHQQQMLMMEAARAAGPQHHGDPMDGQYDGSFDSNSPFNLSPAAAAAASELIQRFITNPGEPISADQFLHVQRKYELPPFEAYQLLLQQIQFQKALLTPPTAATVIKVSHHSYTQSVRDKREEVISFRNDLFKRYTYMRKKEQLSPNSKGKPKKSSTAIQTGSAGADLAKAKTK